MENPEGHSTCNPWSISQFAAAVALQKDDGHFLHGVNTVLAKRFRIAMGIVDSMKEISCAPAEGPSYLFQNAQKNIGKPIRNAPSRISRPCADWF
jgi:aspartate aminotransferase